MKRLFYLVLFFLMIIPGHSIVFINTTDANSDSDSLIEARNKRQFFTPDSLKPEVYLEACKNCDSIELVTETNASKDSLTLLQVDTTNSESIVESSLDTLLCEEYIAEKTHEAKLEKIFKSKPFSGANFEISKLDSQSLEYAFVFFELSEEYGLKFNLKNGSELNQVYALWKVVSKDEKPQLLSYLKSYLFDPIRAETEISSELEAGKVWESFDSKDLKGFTLNAKQKLEVLVWAKEISLAKLEHLSDSTWADWVYGSKTQIVGCLANNKNLIQSKAKGSLEVRKDILAKFSRFEIKNTGSKVQTSKDPTRKLNSILMGVLDYKAILEPSMQTKWENYELKCSNNVNQCFDLFIKQSNMTLVGNTSEIKNGFQLQDKTEGGFRHSLEIVGDNDLFYTPLLTLGYKDSKPFKWSIYNQWAYSEWVKGTELDISIENKATGLLGHFMASQHFWNFENSDTPFEKWFSEKWGGGVSQQKGNRLIEAEFTFSTGTIQKKDPDFTIYELEGFDVMSLTEWSFPLISKNEFKKLEFTQGLKLGMNAFQYQQYQEEGAPLGLFIGFEDAFVYDLNLRRVNEKIRMKWNLSGGSYMRFKSLKNGSFDPVESYSGIGLDEDVNALFYQLMDESYLGRKQLRKESFSKYYLKSEMEISLLLQKFEAKYNLNIWRGGLGSSFDEFQPLQIRNTVEASYNLYKGLNGVLGWGYNPSLRKAQASTIYFRMNRYLPF